MAKKKFEIIYESQHFIIANKPPGIYSIPDRSANPATNLKSQLLKTYQEIYPVHRLDFETSGAIIYARSPDAHKKLNLLFEKREIEKQYLALVAGCVNKSTGTISQPLLESPTRPGFVNITSRGKKAITHFATLEKFKAFTLLEISLETGRMHQIRVHLKSIGHPLAVDSKYGGNVQLTIYDIKPRATKNIDQIARPLINRVSLHAARLSFICPYSKEQLSVTAALPKDLKATLNQLRKWNKV